MANKRGRPAFMPGEARTEKIVVWVEPEMKSWYEYTAKMVGTSPTKLAYGVLSNYMNGTMEEAENAALRVINGFINDPTKKRDE